MVPEVRAVRFWQVRNWSPNARSATTKNFVRRRDAEKRKAKCLDLGHEVEVWSGPTVVMTLDSREEPTAEAVKASIQRGREIAERYQKRPQR